RRKRREQITRRVEHAVDLAHVRVERHDIDDVAETGTGRLERRRQLLEGVAAVRLRPGLTGDEDEPACEPDARRHASAGTKSGAALLAGTASAARGGSR